MTPSVDDVRVIVGSGGALMGTKYPSCNVGVVPPIAIHPEPDAREKSV